MTSLAEQRGDYRIFPVMDPVSFNSGVSVVTDVSASPKSVIFWEGDKMLFCEYLKANGIDPNRAKHNDPFERG